MGACASAPRDPPLEALEDAHHPEPSSPAKATAAGSPVDPKAGRSPRRDRREEISRIDARGSLDESFARAQKNLSRVSVSVVASTNKPKPILRPRREDSAFGRFETTPQGGASRAWPAWLVKHAGDALRSLDGPRDLASFTKKKQVGQGTYGAVYACVDEKNGRRVALKKIKPASLASAEACAFAAREILILLRLRHHAHAVRLLDIAVDYGGWSANGETGRRRKPENADAAAVFLVLEFLEHDIAGLTACTELGGLRLGQVKRLAWQLFTALEQSHLDGILHRDVKGSNLLVDATGNLKLADWGLAVDVNKERKKTLNGDGARNANDAEETSPRALTPTVVTLWYRPPELLLGATAYDGRVDVWSVGCLLAELINGEPVFPGQNETEQLSAIVAACAPNADAADVSKIMTTCGSRGGPELSAALAALGIASHGTNAGAKIAPGNDSSSSSDDVKRRRTTLREKFAGFPDEALDLLLKVLVLDPKRRLTATQALAHPFFSTGPAPEPLNLKHLENSHEFATRRRRNAQCAAAGVSAPRRSINRLTRGETFDPKALSYVVSTRAAASKENIHPRSEASTRSSSRASRVSADESPESEGSFTSVSDAAEMAMDESGTNSRASGGSSEDRNASADENN